MAWRYIFKDVFCFWKKSIFYDFYAIQRRPWMGFLLKKQTCTPQQATALTESILNMLITDMRPLSVVDGEGFQEETSRANLPCSREPETKLKCWHSFSMNKFVVTCYRMFCNVLLLLMWLSLAYRKKVFYFFLRRLENDSFIYISSKLY